MKNMRRFITIACIALLMAACSRPTLDTYERFFFRTDGAELAVQVDGNRNSKVFILLLHGGPGGNGYWYNGGSYAEMLEEKYAMVYLDQRGQGASQGNYAREIVTLQQFSDDIYALAQFLKQKYGQDISLFLMGHSWGGTTGTHALIHTPVQTEIKGWIEVAGAHDIPLLNKEAINMFLTIGQDEISKGNQIDRWQEIVDFAKGVDTTLISNEEGGQINNYGYVAEELISEINDSNNGSYSHSFWVNPTISIAGFMSGMATSNAIFTETEESSMTNELYNISVASLFLWGKYDFVVPPALGESAFARVSSQDKELVIFDRSGHSPMDTEPEGFVSALEGFVERNK